MWRIKDGGGSVNVSVRVGRKGVGWAGGWGGVEKDRRRRHLVYRRGSGCEREEGGEGGTERRSRG